MNLSNVVYNFAVALKNAAASGAALEGAKLQADFYEEVNEPGGTKLIRVGDLIGSIPQPITTGELKEFNAVLDVQFLQIPVTQEITNKLAARQTADQMALDFIKAVYDDQKLGTNNCNIVDKVSVQKTNDQRKVSGNVKVPISIVRLTMNRK